MNEPTLLEEIQQEAERIRSDGSLPDGFEEKLRQDFARLTADPAGLEARAKSASPAPQGGKGYLGQGRSLKSRLRSRLGRPLRRLQQRAIGACMRASWVLSTRRLVLADRLNDLRLRSGPVARTLRLLLGRGGEVAELSPPPSLRGSGDRLVDGAIEAFLAPLLGELGGRPVLVVDRPGGALHHRLLVALSGSARAATTPFPALMKSAPKSLGAVVAEAAAGELGGLRGRSFVRLAAARLAPGGWLVVLSEMPGWRRAFDPLAADLSSFQPATPQTWSYLLASNGLTAVQSIEAIDGSAFLVAARARP